MAIVAKSIIYAWPSVTQSSPNGSSGGIFTVASFGNKTLYFPEVSSRVFKSVYAEVSFHDNIVFNTDGGLQSLKLDLTINGTGISSSITWTPNIGTSGENLSFVGGPFDFTTFFNTNVPSNLSSVGIIASLSYLASAGTTTLMQNASFKLYCTYEHDDADTTYIKTVIIPLESPIAGLATTAPGTLGNQQIPRLLDYSFIDTTQLEDLDLTTIPYGNKLSDITLTQSGDYRVRIQVNTLEPPTSATVRVNSNNRLLASGGPTSNLNIIDAIVTILPSEVPTKLIFRYENNGSNFSARAITNLNFPALAPGFLPESNVNIRDYFIEIEGNEAYGGSTDISLIASIDTNPSFNFGSLERSQNSDTYDRLIWNIPIGSLPDTSQPHNFELRSNVANTFRHVPINLYVTYEYNKTTTTKVNNTIILPWTLATPLTPNGTTFAQNSSTASTLLHIFEPNPLLRQSALRINWNANNLLTTAFVRINSQVADTSYTDGGSAFCGMNSLQHRFDTGAANPNANTANVVLTRGLNYLLSSFYTDGGATIATNINGYYIINYKSDVHPTKGVDGCVRSYFFSNDPISSRTAVITPTYTFKSFFYNLSNSSSLYVIDNAYIINTFNANAQVRFDAGIDYANNEVGNIAGIYPSLNLYKNNILTDAELGTTITTITGQPFIKNYTNQPFKDGLYNNFINRDYRFYWESPGGTSYTGRYGTSNILIANSYTISISGQIYNYTGNGSGITVDIYNQNTEQLLLQITSSVGGVFSGTIFDDGSLVFASVTTGETYGRSKAINPTGSLDVYLIPFEYGYSSM